NPDKRLSVNLRIIPPNKGPIANPINIADCIRPYKNINYSTYNGTDSG
ncbi:17924_t:CDS:2, partial [Racocetra fulgida]